MAKCIVNPLCLFLGIWVGATVLYLGGVYAGLFPRGTPGATGAIFLNIIAFTLGYLTWSTFCRLDGQREGALAASGVPLTTARFKTSLNVTLVFGLIAVGSCAVRLVALARTHQIDLLDLVSDPVLCRRTVTAFVDQRAYIIRLCTIVITVASSIFSIGFVFLGILVYFGRSWRRYGYVLLFLFISLAVGLLSLARKEFTINVLFLVLSYMFMHHVYRARKTAEVLRTLLVPMVCLVCLFLLIDLLLQKSQTYERQGRLLGFLFSLYWYIASPLAAFAEFMKDHNHIYLMGQSLFFPLYKWLCRLCFAPVGTAPISVEMLRIPYPANVYSYLRNMYEDFGFIGVAVFPYLLGWGAADMRRRAERFLPFLNIYLVLLVLIIFSFYNYLLVSNQFYVQALFALVFFRFNLTGLDRVRL